MDKKKIFFGFREEVAGLLQDMDGDEDTIRRIAAIKKEMEMCVAQHPQIIKDPALKMIPDAAENILNNMMKYNEVSKRKELLSSLLNITDNEHR